MVAKHTFVFVAVYPGNQCYAEYIGYEIMLLFEFDERSINSIFN